MAHRCRRGAVTSSAPSDLLDAIASNEDNLSYGSIVSVQIGREEYLTALTNGSIDELRDMLLAARVSVEEWHHFLEDFIEPDIVARVKYQPPQ